VCRMIFSRKRASRATMATTSSWPTSPGILTVMENAKREDTRLKMQTARDNLAKAENDRCWSKSWSRATPSPANLVTTLGRLSN